MPAASLIARASAVAAFQAKPNSVWGGVPFGIFAPYRFGPEASDLEGVLKALVKFGVSQTELSNAVVESYLGAPQPAGARRWRRRRTRHANARTAGGSTSRGRAVDGVATSIADGQVQAVRKKFDDAGVTIYAYRLTLRADMPDAEYDYTFNAAKALGATQITMELPSDRRSRSASATSPPSTRSTSATTCTRPRRSPPGTRRWRSRRATACSSTSATTSPVRA